MKLPVVPTDTPDTRPCSVVILNAPWQPKPVMRKGKSLVLLLALGLLRKCCPVMIKLQLMQHPRCAHYVYKPAVASSFVTTKP